MNDLNIRRLVGQRMVVGFDGTELNEDIIDLVSKYKIGNIILFKHNITSNNQLKKLCKDLQDLVRLHTGYDPFITIDQEGGMITRLGEDAVNVPGAMAIAATKKIENAALAGRLTGEQLSDVGVNFNLAPTVDVNSNKDNPVIGVRSYGDNPIVAAEYAEAMTRGLLEGGVYACAKHFPGHGDTNVDSHIGLPTINKTLEELAQCEMIPFQRVIKAGIPAIMTTHILFPKIEEEGIPATMSYKIITGLLKEQLGYQGLVVSDCMEMSAIKKYYGTVYGCIRGIKAGVDLIFISHTASVAREVSDALCKALLEGELSIEDIEDSVKKIIEYKERLQENKKSGDFDVKKGKEIAFDLLKQSITPVNRKTESFSLGSNPLFIGAPAFRATNVSNQEEPLQFALYMEEVLGGRGIVISPNPDGEEIEQIAGEVKDATSIVVGTYNGHLYKGQLELIKELSIRHPLVLAIALRNPYDLSELPKEVYSIAAYEYTVNSFNAIIELLEHKFEPAGVLPVEL